MVQVRLRLAAGPRLHTPQPRRSSFLLLTAELLRPMALVCLAFGLWRLASQLELVPGFAFHGGFFSRWQAWALLALSLELMANLLRQRSGPDSRAAP